MKKVYMKKLTRSEIRDEYRLCLEAAERTGRKWEKLVVGLLGEPSSEDWFAKEIIERKEAAEKWHQLMDGASLFEDDADEGETRPMSDDDYAEEAEDMKISLVNALERAYIDKHGVEFVRTIIETGASLDFDGFIISDVTLRVYESRR